MSMHANVRRMTLKDGLAISVKSHGPDNPRDLEATVGGARAIR